jgi:hypothetical protein
VIHDNILINTSGRENHYQGVDHNAEKNIKFQKVCAIDKCKQMINSQFYRIILKAKGTTPHGKG